MKELVGKQIKSYSLKNEGELLEIVAKDENGKVGEIHYKTWGECCSISWFESIDGDLFAGKVIKVEEVEEVEEVDMDSANLKPHPNQEEDELYGYKIFMKKHIVDIVYRNSSNGYYGGECRCIRNDFKRS